MSILLAICHNISGNNNLADFYAEHLRGNLFNGFLTLAAFLLSAKTFIVIHLQKELYGTSRYHEQIRELRQAKPSLPFYAPLRRLSQLLFWTILLSLITAVSQLTIGLWNTAWASSVCIGLAVITIMVFGFSFAAMSCALRDWFNRLEADEAENAKQKQ